MEAYPAVLAISYRVLPELRRVVEAWEVRALVAGVGVLAAYILLRYRTRPAQFGSWLGAASRLLAGVVAAGGIWLAVDLTRGEAFLTELWAEMPPAHMNAVKGLVLVGGGWAAWAVAVAELLRRAAVAGSRGSSSTDPTKTEDPEPT